MLNPDFVSRSVIRQILKAEGGYVNSPHDPGGETKYGISKRAYPNEDIANLTVDRAIEIYRNDYWYAIRGYDLPPPLALLVMDHAVNAGVSAASVMLQKLIDVPADGIIGPQTVASAQAFWDRHGTNTLEWYSRERILFYSRLAGWKHWARGWTHRVQDTQMTAAKWAVALAVLKEAGLS
jgi:lysozyme family protein